MEPAVRVGATIAAVIALLPYLNDLLITAFVAGALGGVWFASRRQENELSLSEGARIGFLSGFYGLLAASAIYDLLWQIFQYQLWRVRNLDRVIALSADAFKSVFSPSTWFVVTLQIIVAAICAGAFGAPSGLLGVKIFSRRS